MPLPFSLLPGLARAADVATRNDAISHCIVGERDYVANFLATLRNVWRLLGGDANLHNVILPPAVEQLTGCDFALVLQTPRSFKALLVEAKWVRRVGYKGWDYRSAPSDEAIARYFAGAAGPPRISHFSDQIARQAAWQFMHPQFAIAEMFLQLVTPAAAAPPYNNPTLFDEWGSTFIAHARAASVINPPPVAGATQFPPTRLWHSAPAGGGLSVEVEALAAPHSMHVQDLLNLLVACKIGRPIAGQWLAHLIALRGGEGHRNQLLRDPEAVLGELGLRHALILRGAAPRAWKPRADEAG